MFRQSSVAAASYVAHDYERLSAQEKQDLLWRKISTSRYATLPALHRSKGLLPTLRLTQALIRMSRRTYLNHVDVLEPRTKTSHPFGVTGQAVFRATAGAKLGGVLSGAPLLIRLSIAGDPAEDGFAPAMALKFLIDGFPSSNLHVAASLDGQGSDHNFFRDALTNILPPPRSAPAKLALPLLSRLIGKRNPLLLELDHLTFRDSTGDINYAAAIPYQIFFEPQVKLAVSRHDDFRANLATINSGTVLYDVKLNYSPEGDLVQAGQIVLTSELMASEFGDRVLHFHHRSKGVD